MFAVPFWFPPFCCFFSRRGISCERMLTQKSGLHFFWLSFGVCHNHKRNNPKKLGWNPESPRVPQHLAIFRVGNLSMVTVGAEMVDPTGWKKNSHSSSLPSLPDFPQKASKKLRPAWIKVNLRNCKATSFGPTLTLFGGEKPVFFAWKKVGPFTSRRLS